MGRVMVDLCSLIPMLWYETNPTPDLMANNFWYDSQTWHELNTKLEC
jgi:hypothetical protein